MRYGRVAGVVLATAAASVLGLATAQQIHRNGFETRETGWLKGAADAPFQELVHEVTDATARTGQYCEHIRVHAEAGSYVYYYYPTSKAPVSDELSISLWLKANRPGLQLLGRLVLPKERNPKNLDEPLTVMLRGDNYEETSRWHRLQLRRPSALAAKQQQLMRAQLQHDVDFTDAYIDQIVLNLYAGPGFAEAWIDDVEIGPLLESSPFQTTSRPAGPARLLAPGTTPRTPARAVIEMDRGQLLVNGKRFFFRGIRHSDTPLNTLRDAGFNTIWFDPLTSPALMEEAVNLGFWLVPALPTTENDPRLASADSLRQEIARFLERDAVLFWDVGGGLTEEQANIVVHTAQMIRAADPGRPVGGDAWDGLDAYSFKLDLLGVHRWPLMTGLEIGQYRRWLNQRRLRAREGVFLWTWVQTHLPDWYTALVYKRPSMAGFDEPVGPQPEQIQLLTFAAISAGCRGIGFWSDRFLADSHQGRDRLLTLGLLNLQLKMLEPLLETADNPARDDFSWIATSHPDVRAGVLRTKYGLLVMPMWVGKGAQFVPGQAAVGNLTITVPQVPVGTRRPPWSAACGKSASSAARGSPSPSSASRAPSSSRPITRPTALSCVFRSKRATRASWRRSGLTTWPSRRPAAWRGCRNNWHGWAIRSRMGKNSWTGPRRAPRSLSRRTTQATSRRPMPRPSAPCGRSASSCALSGKRRPRNWAAWRWPAPTPSASTPCPGSGSSWKASVKAAPGRAFYPTATLSSIRWRPASSGRCKRRTWTTSR
ncbi:MAG: hypothetical protein E6K70_14830 [Planctomycetota bacterium]|nr:MAG: hypothetical protein E6K70_14830 [Planctomycetota bacterium]